MVLKKQLTVYWLIVTIPFCHSAAQSVADSISDSKWSSHFQLTVISQSHLAFNAKYSGKNSLADTAEYGTTSISSTLFFGRKLWKGAALYFDPEISGGSGLSYALGVAGALNGETYRIGNPAPGLFVARAYYEQYIPIGNYTYERMDDDLNQISGMAPTSYIRICAGKFSLSDFFDDNNYSHEARSQFLNWSLMSNGAWDYPANTRGYTFGGVVELVKPNWAIRFSSVAVPIVANHSNMEYNANAHSETLEGEKSLLINKRSGKLRLLVTNTYSRAPSYKDAIKAIEDDNTYLLNVMSGNAEATSYGGHKLGLGFSGDQELSDEVGIFARAGWNDGQHASWAFTEIDQTASVGLSIKGIKWKRADDVIGIAAVVNGISKVHQQFLADGGYGFIIGDGALNYGHESIMEFYYNARLTKFFWLSADYEFVNNPGYNKDRGPVNVFAFRGHIEL